jgi:hypothetical protein
MNYLKAYCNLIRKAENRTLPEGYTEKYHTFPVSIFGKNNRIVVLTNREHYIAHALLEKICLKRYGENHGNTVKMSNAHTLMISNGRYYNSHLYEGARIRVSKSMMGNKRGVGRKSTEEEKENLRIKATGRLHTEETKQKLSKHFTENPSYGMLGKGEKYEWKNSNGSIFYGTTAMLIRNFPEQKLDFGYLHKMIQKNINKKELKGYNTYKGWTVYELAQGNSKIPQDAL